MILADANLLLYAYNASAPEHARAKAWLESSLSNAAPFALCWWTIGAFLRLSTHRRIYPAPLAIDEASNAVTAWLERPMVVLVEPGPRYWPIARQLLEESNARGPLVADALIAALCIEHGATLATHDTDFRRFPALATTDPIAS
jgi:toxin-antitoxin system PIN domain toxin